MKGGIYQCLSPASLKSFLCHYCLSRAFCILRCPIFFDKPEYVNSSCGELETEVERMEARLDALISNRSGKIGI